MSRLTTVHDRYHIIGLFDDEKTPEGELADTAESRAAAFRIAKRLLRPRGFDRVHVRDSMAQRGRPQLWAVTAEREIVLERREVPA